MRRLRGIHSQLRLSVSKARVLSRRITHRRVHRVMGSLPDGSRRAYCGKNAAGYIPDGCIGPVCMGTEHCGYEKFVAGGWEGVVKGYLELATTAWRGRLAGRVTLPLDVLSHEIELHVYRFMWHT